MPYEVVRRRDSDLVTPSLSRPARQVGRALGRLQADTAVRLARVQAEGIVQAEKIRELSNLAREAMTDHALLTRHREVLAGADPLLHDELRYFSDLAKLGAGEVMADTIGTYCRESRGQR